MVGKELERILKEHGVTREKGNENEGPYALQKHQIDN